MGEPNVMPASQVVAILVGALLVAGTVIYFFMVQRVEHREFECKERCANRGASQYRYTPPQGSGRRVSQDSCECVR